MLKFCTSILQSITSLQNIQAVSNVHECMIWSIQIPHPHITAYHVIQYFYNFDNCALLPLPQGDKELVKMKFQRKGFLHLRVEIPACSDWPAQWQLLHLYQPLHDSETDFEGTPQCRCLVGWAWAAYGLHPAEAGTVTCSPSQPVGKRTEHNLAAATLAEKRANVYCRNSNQPDS